MNNIIRLIKESKFGGTLGWIFGAIGIVLTVYYGAIKKDEPKLEYSIIAKTDFFNNSESVSGLKIFFEDSINIQEKHLNITTYSIKIENIGSKHIEKSDYVEGFFGLEINNGTLLDVPVLLSSTGGYIDNAFYVDTNVKGGTRIVIPKLAIDKNDNYIIKVVLLHDIDSIPRFQTQGKIIGQKKIEIKEEYKDAKPKKISTLSIIVGLVSALFVFGLNSLLDTIIDRKVVKWRSKQSDEELRRKKDEIDNLPDIMPAVKEEYITNGYPSIALLELFFITENEPAATNEYRKMTSYLHNNKSNSDEDYKTVKREYDKYQSYIEKGFIILNEDFSITFNKEAKESVKRLLGFLREKRELTQKTSRSLKDILDNPQ